MLQGEHSAILSAFIKLPFVITPFFGLFLSGPFTQVLLYCFIQFSHYVLRVNKWYNKLYVASAMTYRIYPKYSDSGLLILIVLKFEQVHFTRLQTAKT